MGRLGGCLSGLFERSIVHMDLRGLRGSAVGVCVRVCGWREVI
jgi:hypothetical protein